MHDPISMERLRKLLPQVIALAKMAGDAVMKIYDSGDIETEIKGDASPLTAADLASHRIIVEGLGEILPGWPVLSEESAEVAYEERGAWHRYWLVDPLDGTKEFVNRNGEFTINIALIEEGFPVLGVVYAPAIGRLYCAAAGGGAFRIVGDGESRLRVSASCDGKVRVVASRSHRGEEMDAFLGKIGEYESISMGSSLKFCLVAEGEADLYPRLGPTMEWDTAAAQCIVEEAGGAVCDLNGNRLRYNKPDLHNPKFTASIKFSPSQQEVMDNALAIQGKINAI